MLEALKNQVVLYARQAEEMGLCRHRSGNFSVRDQASGLICMTPTGVDRQAMQPEDVVVMDTRAEIVESLNGLMPTSEALMHLAAYEAVVSEIAHLGCRRGYIPVAAYGRQGSKELADSVRVPLAASDAILLASHGVLTVDAASLEEALLKAAYVEEIAEIYYHALLLSGGKEPATLPAEDLVLQYPAAVTEKK